MTNELKGGGSNELSTDINTITAEINAYQRVAGEAIFEIGRRLKHVKEKDLVHGEFGEWHEDELGINRSVAAKFMKIVDELGESKVSTSTRLGMDALYAIATLPPEHRESSHTIPSTGKSKKPEDMTVRELREVKRQLKAEQERVNNLETERNAEMSERERLEIENEELYEKAEKPPKIEVRTEYVEVRDEELERRLASYEEKFGDLDNYNEKITATHRQDMLVAVMSFSQGVREFIKRYEYMTKYKSVIDNLDDESKAQYDEAVNALKGMAQDFEFTTQGNDIIDAEFSEIN